jgi:hypothetical protein
MTVPVECLACMSSLSLCSTLPVECLACISGLSLGITSL